MNGSNPGAWDGLHGFAGAKFIGWTDLSLLSGLCDSLAGFAHCIRSLFRKFKKKKKNPARGQERTEREREGGM